MSTEFSMFAVSAERYELLRSNPQAVTEEARLRDDLRFLAWMRNAEPDISEAEAIKKIRDVDAGSAMNDPELRRHYMMRNRLVDAALARGDREPACGIGKNWVYLTQMLGGPNGAPMDVFFQGGTRLGDDVGYGPAGLHSPQEVAAIADHLRAWTPDRFVKAARIGEPRDDDRYPLPPASRAAADAHLMGFFNRFRDYILNAAKARAAMLVWMS